MATVLRELLALVGFDLDDNDLRDFNDRLNQARGTLGSIKGVAVTAAAALAGVVTGHMARRLLETNAEYERLLARLETLEGGADKGRKAFERLQDFASRTPFQLNEVVDAYSALKAAGFDASDKNMEALGDLANSSGKSLGEMVEILKSAGRGLTAMVDNIDGLQATKKGTEITFKNFRNGFSEVIDMSDEAARSKIFDFFVKAGEDNAAGAMAAQMKTLNGQMSNLSDNIWKFFVAVGDTGVRDRIGALFKTLIGGSAEASGDLASMLGAVLIPLLDGANKVIGFGIKNWKMLSAGIAYFGTVLAGIQIAAFVASVGGLHTLISGLLITLATAAAPLIPLVAKVALATAAIVGLVLVAEDLYNAFTGKKSAIRSFVEQFQDSDGILGSVARTIDEIFDGVVKLARKGRELGARFMAGIAPVTALFAEFAQQLGGELLAGAREVFGFFAGEAEGNVSTIAAAFNLMAAVAEEVFPVVLGTARVALLGLLMLWKGTWSGIKFVLGALWAGFTAVWGALKGPVASFAAAAIGAVSRLWFWVKVAAILIQEAFTALWSALRGPTGKFASWVMSTWSKMVEALSSLLAPLAELLQPVWDAVGGAFGKVVGKMKSTWDAFVKDFMEAAQYLGNAVGIDVGAINASVDSAMARAAGPLGSGTPALAAAGAGGGTTNQTVTANAGGITVNVTQTNAGPNEIAGAAQRGIGMGLDSALNNARRNMSGGAS